MKKVIGLFLFVISFSSNAQEFKFGDVSKEELQEKQHSKYKEASAAVLYRDHDISINYDSEKGFVKKSEIVERIKIYSKEGFEYATKIIKLYSETPDTKDQMSGLKAYTYNLENGKIEATKLTKNGIFKEDLNKYWNATKFTMPKIKEGCVIEYKYIIRSKILGFEQVPFQKSIPINTLNFQVATPEYFVYNTLINPRANFHPKLEHATSNDEIRFNSKSRTGMTTVTTTYETSKVDYKVNIIRAKLKDIPALTKEQFIDNLNNYQSKMLMELTSVNFPNEPIRNLSTSWEKVALNIYDDSDFGLQIKKRSYFKKHTDQLLNGVSDPGEKLSVIFGHIKDKVKWNGLYGYSTNSGVARAYKEGSGNIAEINLMLVAMLQEYGFNANPVLVSTKKNGVPLLPTQTGFNYVICALENNGKHILLDASEIYSIPNILPERVLNWQGRLIRKDKSSQWISLSPKVSSKENVNLNVFFNDDFSIFGKIRHVYMHYKAKKYRDEYNNISDEDLISDLENKNGELNVSNFKVDNNYDLSKPIMQSYDYTIDDAVEDIGGSLYFSPLLFLAKKENPFLEEKRVLPIDFVFPTSSKYMININIPEGYVVDTLPQNSKLNFNGTDAAFSYLIRQSGNVLQCQVTLEINNTFILPVDYSSFKEFYKSLIDKQAEKIVLKQI